MVPARIAELLLPFLNRCHTEARSDEESAVLSPGQISQISTYLELLLRWNARINLTAIRDEESIVIRHFGESLFAARHLFPASIHSTPSPSDQRQEATDQRPATSDQRPATDLLDLGSGAGFPGLPMKIWSPALRVTLIESNHKKATFLREVVRSLPLSDVTVSTDRAEHFPGKAELVTLRAVERFETTLPVAARLVEPQGRLALLIGESQIGTIPKMETPLTWLDPVPIPLSTSRVLLIGTRNP